MQELFTLRTLCVFVHMVSWYHKNIEWKNIGLKFKTILGYGILIVLLAVTIYLFRSEQVKRNTLLRNERKLVATWQLTEYCLEHKVSFNKMYQIVREEFPNMSSIPGYRKLTHLGFLYSKFYEEYKNLCLYNRPVKHPFFLVGQAEHSADLLTHPEIGRASCRERV